MPASAAASASGCPVRPARRHREGGPVVMRSLIDSSPARHTRALVLARATPHVEAAASPAHHRSARHCDERVRIRARRPSATLAALGAIRGRGAGLIGIRLRLPASLLERFDRDAENLSAVFLDRGGPIHRSGHTPGRWHSSKGIRSLDRLTRHGAAARVKRGSPSM
jgi:hypothetical protein